MRYYVFKQLNIGRWAKPVLLTILFLLFNFVVFTQPFIFKGIVKDEQTLKPIPGVNIKVYGTTKGTATDNTGRFSINIDKIPVPMIFSCIGYENEFYKVTGIPKTPVEFLLRSKTYTLKEVNITSKNYSYLFKNRDYSVFDYELMDDNVLLLIFRTLLKQSELVLLDRSGDTLAVSKLPEVPPSRLFKDFLSNIHYFSKNDYAYQCSFNKASNDVDFLYKTTVDSVEKLLKPFLFNIGGRLYFQESLADNFGTAIGYYEKGNGKKYIRQVINQKKITEYKDDQEFYNSWNDFVSGGRFVDADDIENDMAAPRTEGELFGKNEARAHSFEFFNMIYPVFKTRDNTIAFFNFSDDVLELMNKDGRMMNAVPISFHHEPVATPDTTGSVRLYESGWRWGNTILVDELNRDMYTAYLKAGMVRIHKIDLRTGNLNKGTLIPFPFPEKIEIYDGVAYFLNKGINENWKLAKCEL